MHVLVDCEWYETTSISIFLVTQFEDTCRKRDCVYCTPWLQGGAGGDGFEVTKYGDGRVALIGEFLCLCMAWTYGILARISTFTHIVWHHVRAGALACRRGFCNAQYSPNVSCSVSDLTSFMSVLCHLSTLHKACFQFS